MSNFTIKAKNCTTNDKNIPARTARHAGNGIYIIFFFRLFTFLPADKNP